MFDVFCWCLHLWIHLKILVVLPRALRPALTDILHLHAPAPALVVILHLHTPPLGGHQEVPVSATRRRRPLTTKRRQPSTTRRRIYSPRGSNCRPGCGACCCAVHDAAKFQAASIPKNPGQNICTCFWNWIQLLKSELFLSFQWYAMRVTT
jgi:hypothetical protein